MALFFAIGRIPVWTPQEPETRMVRLNEMAE